jgi:uncharacterized protein (DUF4415 family)
MIRIYLGDEPRKLIGIRLDAKVLGQLRQTVRKKGLPYQSLVNEILASEMRKASQDMSAEMLKVKTLFPATNRC